MCTAFGIGLCNGFDTETSTDMDTETSTGIDIDASFSTTLWGETRGGLNDDTTEVRGDGRRGKEGQEDGHPQGCECLCGCVFHVCWSNCGCCCCM